MQLGMFEPVTAVPTAPELNLRGYQQAAREAVAKVHSRVRGALVVHGTGLGKTRTCGAVAWDFKLRGGKVLMLCPSIEITRQCYESMRALGLSSTIEQAENHAYRPLPDVVVACVATMRGQRLKAFQPDDFALVIVDEAHASVADRYREIFAYFASAKLLGCTATADRTDGVSLANVFDEVAHEMHMWEGIKQGYLAPLHFKTAITNFDAKKLRTIAGDVDAGSVAKEITRSGLLHEAAATLAELAGDQRIVAFLPTVASSKAFTAELLARGIPAEHIDGETPSEVRKVHFANVRNGTVRVLSSVGCLVEGFDLPELSVCALLNPSKSRSRITQMIGRVTRLAPGKTHATVIDFCPGRMKKGRLASPADALAGKMLDDSVHNLLAKEGDLAEAIETATRTSEELAERKRKQIEAAEKRRIRARELAKLARERDFRYQVETHDAADILDGSGNGHSDVMERAVTRPASEEQINRLLAWGLPKAKVSAMTASEANKVISQMIGRAKAGMASYKQLKWIRSYVPVSDNTPMTVAGQAIEYIKRSRRPDPKVLSSILEGRA